MESRSRPPTLSLSLFYLSNFYFSCRSHSLPLLLLCFFVLFPIYTRTTYLKTIHTQISYSLVVLSFSYTLLFRCCICNSTIELIHTRSSSKRNIYIYIIVKCIFKLFIFISIFIFLSFTSPFSSTFLFLF